MQKITPCLWFDGRAEAAVQFYVSLFKESRVGRVTRYDAASARVSGMPEGSVLTVTFTLAGQEFMALNGGPQFPFSPAVSFFVTLESETEVQALWDRLLDGGTVLMPLQAYDWSPRYGWLSDRFGLSWQVSLGESSAVGQTIIPSLLFVGPQHGRAEEAVRHYTSIFPDSDVTGILRYGASEGEPEGTVKHAQFSLSGQTFMAMDSSLPHEFNFNEAVSFIINCESQSDVDFYWDKLSAYPEAEQCGWLKDRFGVSWQVVPTILPELLYGGDPARARRVSEALLRMKKIDIEALQRA